MPHDIWAPLLLFLSLCVLLYIRIIVCGRVRESRGIESVSTCIIVDCDAKESRDIESGTASASLPQTKNIKFENVRSARAGIRLGHSKAYNNIRVSPPIKDQTKESQNLCSICKNQGKTSCPVCQKDSQLNLQLNLKLNTNVNTKVNTAIAIELLNLVQSSPSISKDSR